MGRQVKRVCVHIGLQKTGPSFLQDVFFHSRELLAHPPDRRGRTTPHGLNEVLRRIKQEHSDLPVILATARDSDEERTAALAAGAEDYVVKPWSLSRLEQRIREL